MIQVGRSSHRWKRPRVEQGTLNLDLALESDRMRSCGRTQEIYFCVMTTNQAVSFLSSPAITKHSPLLRDLTVLLTRLPSPIKVTSTLGPGNSVISIVHCLLRTICF